ncbi:hypothetical protein NHX12_004372 [Muraenolepis orangiensis]|uniref:Uncharacterized protein n=1 Tax=Muraenolepis orangiensis TaxID=630683 RepID=A0A9Q0DYX0_9TELE|nr:hypothetical protein NHX12_004372 [Muraenolepis orangiensis]
METEERGGGSSSTLRWSSVWALRDDDEVTRPGGAEPHEVPHGGGEEVLPGDGLGGVKPAPVPALMENRKSHKPPVWGAGRRGDAVLRLGPSPGATGTQRDARR